MTVDAPPGIGVHLHTCFSTKEPRKAVTVKSAASEGDRVELLTSMRDRLAPVCLDTRTATRELASLSQRLLEILRELATDENRGERRELLVKLRVRVAGAVDSPDTPVRDLAALSKRLMDIAEEVDLIDLKATVGNPIAKAVQVPDEAM
jgi:hypothetical protein